MPETQLVNEIENHTAEELPDFIKEMGGAVPANTSYGDEYTGGVLPQSQPPPGVESRPIREIGITEDLSLSVETTSGEKKTYKNWSHVLLSDRGNDLMDRLVLSPNTPQIKSLALKFLGAASNTDDVFWGIMRAIADRLLDSKDKG